MASEQMIRDTASGFFDAIEAREVETMKSLLTPDIDIWHNTDETNVTRDFTVALLSGLLERVDNVKYSDRRLCIIPGGFVQQHVLEGDRKADGKHIRLPAAILCQVEDGKISKIEEYFDSAQVALFM